LLLFPPLFPFPLLFFLELPELPLPDPSPEEPLLTVFPRLLPTELDALATLADSPAAIVETDVILVRVEIILFVIAMLVELTACVVA
jgi:hypothetical protein